MIRSPRGPGSVIALPLRKTVSDLACAACQSRCRISSPSAVNQAMSDSSSWVPSMGRPWKKRRRRKTGWSRRSHTICRTKASISRSSSRTAACSCCSWRSGSERSAGEPAGMSSAASAPGAAMALDPSVPDSAVAPDAPSDASGPPPPGHRTHASSLSWQYALLLPFWVRPNSSPWLSIGTPCDSSSVAMKLRIWRARSSWTAGSSVGPSAPQFQDRLKLSPSWLSSPLASLCLLS